MAVSSPVQDSASALRAEQLEQAEELLFSGAARAGFAKALFRGEFRGKAIFPYPELTASERPVVEEAVAAVRAFAEQHIDAAAIDRDADIPRSVIDGLAELGVLGMAAPVELGGRGVLADGLLPDHGGDRRPLRRHGRVRQRAPLDRPPGAGPLRHARAEGALAAPADPAARNWRRSP